MNNVNSLDKTKTIKPILKGYMYSVLITCVFLFIYATILVNTDIGENTITPVVIIITAISILIGSSISCLKIKKNGIVNGLCIGAFYFITLYILSSITVTGFGINLKAIIMILTGTALGGIGGIIGVNVGK